MNERPRSALDEPLGAAALLRVFAIALALVGASVAFAALFA